MTRRERMVRTTDGVDIATFDLGGDGPPLLLAHATGFHGRLWQPVAAALVRQYRCVAFDSRGHGESTKDPGGDYDWSGFARDVLAVVDGLSLEGVRGVGHSCGAAALLLAEQAAPGTFESLYCYEPVIFPADGPTDNSLAAGARRRRDTFTSRRAAYDNYAAKPPFVAFDPDALEAYVEWGFEDLPDGSVRLRCRPEDEARIYEMAPRHRAYLHLGEVGCPVTLACGGAHAHFGVELMNALAARLPRATVCRHDHLGHFGPMEQPGEIAAGVIAAFAG